MIHVRHIENCCFIRAALFAAAAFFCAARAEDKSGPAARTAEFDTAIKPFFAQHCYGCHGEKKQKGKFRIDTAPKDADSAGFEIPWGMALERLTAGEMPPEDEPQPTAKEREKVIEWISAQLQANEARRYATTERVSFRKLTREEYVNSIRDLLGVTYDAYDPTGLPEDPEWQGFERIGSVLTLSPTHVEKYLAAAEKVLSEALALKPQPKRDTGKWTAAQSAGGDLGKELARKGILDKVRKDIVPNNGQLDGVSVNVAVAGEYIFHAKMSGLRPPGGRAPRFKLYATDFSRTLFEQDVETAEDAPVTLEFRTHLPVGGHHVLICNAVPGPDSQNRPSRPLGTRPFFTMKDRVAWQIKLTDDDGKPIWPTILLDTIEWEGPVYESWPPPAHQRIFFGGESATKDIAYAREILTRFAARAYRRPLESPEIDRLVALVEKAQKLGDNFESSIKTALLAVLCSNNFLYLIEGNIAKPSPRLTDFELASRLSYFIWSTLPDERLIDLAAQGKLHESGTLGGEIRRMLKDPKALAFSESFPRQWLQLRNVGMFAPDKKLFPDYDDYLEKSMIAETTSFFREVVLRNQSIREFLDSDWTMLNERLAGHYGVTGVSGEALQRTVLKPGDHRGGLLTQASILSLTSDGTRHRPVHRGKWVLEAIVGKPPPPPPPNVPAIKTSTPTEPKLSLRAKIEAHRSDANCAACHRKIDPLGLAFDNYDAIGHWREEEAVGDGAGKNPKLDPSGELPDGRKFADAAGLKKLMVADLDKFANAFTEKLATYALRRGMTFADRLALNEIAAKGKAQDYKLTALIEALVLSDLFQRR